MIRYGFNIRTRNGQRVENVSIMAASLADAERRLRQMYEKCEIVECLTQAVPRRIDTLDLASVIELIGASGPLPLVTPPAPPASGDKSGAR